MSFPPSLHKVTFIKFNVTTCGVDLKTQDTGERRGVPSQRFFNNHRRPTVAPHPQKPRPEGAGLWLQTPPQTESPTASCLSRNERLWNQELHKLHPFSICPTVKGWSFQHVLSQIFRKFDFTPGYLFFFCFFTSTDIFYTCTDWHCSDRRFTTKWSSPRLSSWTNTVYLIHASFRKVSKEAFTVTLMIPDSIYYILNLMKPIS